MSELTRAIEALIEAEVQRRVAYLTGERSEPYSVDEAAHVLGLAKSTIYGMTREGRLRTVPDVKQVLIPAREIRRILDKRDSAA